VHPQDQRTAVWKSKKMRALASSAGNGPAGKHSPRAAKNAKALKSCSYEYLQDPHQWHILIAPSGSARLRQKLKGFMSLR
jgi:hypothetical protein